MPPTYDLNKINPSTPLRVDAERAKRVEGIKFATDEAAEHFIKVLPKALKDHRHVIVLTHVPLLKKLAGIKVKYRRMIGYRSFLVMWLVMF